MNSRKDSLLATHTTITDRIMLALYNKKLPVRTRNPSKPMAILALGPPRSGTESLRTALLLLGYNSIWHGFELPNRPSEMPYWLALLRAKSQGDTKAPQHFDFDSLLGDVEAVMDVPPAMFGEELVDHYPEAKVVLNRRKDLDAWHRSLSKATDMILGSWFLWTMSWFDGDLYFWFTSALLWFRMMGKYKSFETHGKEWAEEHFAKLESKLRGQGRDYLVWDPKDGWEPLCRFLGKEVPDEEFPWANKTGKEFEANAQKALKKWVQGGLMRMCGFVAVLTGCTAFLWSRT